MAKKSKTKAKAKTKTKTKTKVKKSAAKAKAKKTAKKATGRNAGRKKVVAKTKRAAPKKPQAQPQGYASITAYLVAQDAAAAIDYYKAVFGAKEIMRMPSPGGKVGHAELKIGDSIIMLADEHPDMHAHGPKKFGGSPVTIMAYVKDVDATVARAVERGGKVVRPVEDKFYGDRSGSVEDPQGHVWHISTHVEDVGPKEIKRRMDAMIKEMPKEAAADSDGTSAGG